MPYPEFAKLPYYMFLRLIQWDFEEQDVHTQCRAEAIVKRYEDLYYEARNRYEDHVPCFKTKALYNLIRKTLNSSPSEMEHYGQFIFPVFSIYSLYPYFHYKMTGANVLVITVSPGQVDRFYVSGYSRCGRRIFDEHSKNLLRNRAALIGLYSQDSFLFYDNETKDVIYQWECEFLFNKNYTASNRYQRILMIDEYTDASKDLRADDNLVSDNVEGYPK